ncbi:MAG: hypothetical protein ACHQT8_03280 [Chlamydiales bacterium]
MIHALFTFFFLLTLVALAMNGASKTHYLQPLFLAFSSLGVAISIFWRLKKGARYPLLRFFFFLGFLLAVSLTLALAGYYRITREAPLLQVEIPGQKKEDGYLVELHTMEGELLGKYLIQGDLVALRAKIIRTKPLLHFFGVSNLCKVERIFGCYQETADERRFSHSVEDLAVMSTHPLSRFFEKIWANIFFEKEESLWAQNALMQASFFPLVDSSGKPFQGSFFLTLTQTGISSR